MCSLGIIAGVKMEKQNNEKRERGITWFTKEAERTFFFYATIAMFILYGFLSLFVD
jgi:hypothetical protein